MSDHEHGHEKEADDHGSGHDHEEHDHEHGHEEHDHGHEEHDHASDEPGFEYASAHDWVHELEGLRHEARHYYLHGFDWRGHEPPEGFTGPRFYPPASEWRVAAHLDVSVPGVGDTVTLPTSTGQLRPMTIAGQLVFNGANGGEQRLTAYRTHGHGEAEMLFVPFRDTTSGNETYGAGRYLDVPYHEGHHYDLDFNYAYNPSCAFSPAYDCPFPPPGNRVGVAVHAGEMVPFEH